MSVDLSALSFRSAGPQPFRMGGTTRGPLGGSQTINRLGDRWTMAIETRAYHVEPDGRRLSTLIEQALREGAILRVKQPGFNPMIAGAPVVDGAVQAGKSVPLAGLLPNSVIRHGQWVSIIVEGQRYLDKVTEQVIASTAGTATLSLMNLIRKPMPAGAIVELAARIEGTIDEGSYSGGVWAANRTTSWAFTVTEDE
jgi:hypothetical protein